jgi:hypothetical protein
MYDDPQHAKVQISACSNNSRSDISASVDLQNQTCDTNNIIPNVQNAIDNTQNANEHSL